MRLILYSKPGCHLCEGLQEKLEQIHALQFDLEIRDITTRADWFQTYQYEIPVLFLSSLVQPAPVVVSEIATGVTDPASSVEETAIVEETMIPIPRFSPRASVAQIEQSLQQWMGTMHG